MLNNPDYFMNREISWLKFNTRVLQEAEDKNTPILERLRFIAITGSNLDEFFMVRVAGLESQLESGINRPDTAGLTVREQLRRVAEAAHEQIKSQYKVLKGILQELEQHEIYFSSMDSLSPKGKEWIAGYFNNTIYPVITPMAVDASHPFPFLANRSLNIAVLLQREKAEPHTAVIQVPAVLPRIIRVPGHGKQKRFVFLEDVIKEYCAQIFHGYIVKDAAVFRITRNADLAIDEEEAEDLLEEVEKSLRLRKRGDAVRLEIAKQASRTLRQFVISSLELDEQAIYEIAGPIDVTCFMKFTNLPGYDDLRYEPLLPQIPPALYEQDDLFEVIREDDILLHHPYESFEPVVNFVRRAATDPQVLAIKQTLYRVSGNSPIVRALAQAAENGKQVTVLVELKARFDEENNIQWAKRLEEAGCHVIYGLVGLKTHSKITLVVRQESNGIKRYVHLGTGNYNDSTAKVYTDMGLFTANDQFGADASAFFNLLSGYSDPPVWNKFIVAPIGLREKLIDLIDHEIQCALQGREARIIAKMNSLVDREIIMKLYEASSQGVKIDLIVRGICVLKPGIPGVSENITVRSIVGRFLEHSRIFYFANDDDDSEKVFLSSADWMPRNLNQRVELMFPVDHPAHVDTIKSVLALLLRDNQKAHVMRSDGNYRRTDKRGKMTNSQADLYAKAREVAKQMQQTAEQEFKPMYRKEE